MCRSDEHAWEVSSDTCHAKAALDQYREQNKKPAAGELLYVHREELATAYGANPFL